MGEIERDKNKKGRVTCKRDLYGGKMGRTIFYGG
jgi:hypothetical protein